MFVISTTVCLYVCVSAGSPNNIISVIFSFLLQVNVIQNATFTGFLAKRVM